MKTCPRCALKVEDNLRKCNWCGCENLELVEAQINKDYNPGHEGYLLGRAHAFTVFGAIVAFVVRLILSGKQIYDWAEYAAFGYYVTGIHRDYQPFCMIIPAVAAVMSLYYICKDKDADTKYKIRALIIDAIFVTLGCVAILYESVA